MKILHLLIAIIILCFTLTRCTTTKVIQQYKNPDIVSFQGNKILIVGISANKEVRRTYEKKMIEALEKEQLVAVKSIDFFEASFTDNKKSLEELNEIETKLIDAGFDAILFTKVTGQESRVSFVDAYSNLTRNIQSFEEYYYGNQHYYFTEDQERHTVYSTETSLYCICPGKERELIWNGIIEVVDADKINRNIKNYITTLFKALHNNKLLL